MFTAEVALRISLAFGAGLLLGIERESHGRGAGLRTTALVATAACIAMLVSDSFYQQSQVGSTPGGWHPDPTRLAAGVLSGMGFLGAGVVVRQNHIIRGVTTAAVLWFATVIGLAFGTGAIALGLTGLTLAMVTLLVLPFFERFVQNDWYSMLSISVRSDGATLPDIERILKEHQIKLKSVEFDHDLDAGVRKITGQVKYKKVDLIELPEQIGSALSRLPGVMRVEWK